MIAKARCFSFTICLLTLATACQAADIKLYLQHNALCFAVINNVRQTNDRLAKFLNIYQEGLPDPLQMAQAITGLSAGLDLEGDIILALSPISHPSDYPAPMLFLPVSDYASLAKTIKADEKGEITRVALAGEDVLIARRDDKHALVMNVEHRKLMESTLANLAKPSHLYSVPKADTEWLEGNDIAIVITPSGLGYLYDENRSAASRARRGISEHTPTAIQRLLGTSEYQPLLTLFQYSLSGTAIGLTIDETANARLRWHARLRGSNFQFNESEQANKPFTGYAERPYVFVGGGALPVGMKTWLPEWLTQLSKDLNQQGGGAPYTEQDLADVRKSYELAFSRINGASFLLTPAEERQPLLSVFFAKLVVDDSQAYLADIKKCFELSNEMADRADSDIKLNYTIGDVTIAGSPGIEASSDLGKATGDGDNHIWQSVLTSILGTDHKLSIYFTAADKNHIFVGMETSEKLEKFIEAHRQGETGLAETRQVKTTLGMMDTQSEWVTLVNPEGFVELARAAMKSMLVLGGFPEFPTYPNSPPLGMTLTGDDESWNAELVMPVEAARAMAKFSEELDKTIGRQ